jgi:hypothetical protein
VSSPDGLGSGTVSSRRALQRAVEVGLVLVAAVEVLDDIAYLRRRLRRSATLWWSDVELRERHRLHLAEVGFLLRRLPAPRRDGSGGRVRVLTRAG